MKHPVSHAIFYCLWKLCARQTTRNKVTSTIYSKLTKKLYNPRRWPKTASIVAKDYINHTKRVQEQLINKIKAQKKPIRICFAVVYDSVFQGEPLFMQLLNDKDFSPFILVIPDIARGRENEKFQLQKTLKSLRKKYGDKVQSSYSYQDKRYKDYSEEIDIICTANPYDQMTHPLYSITYLSQKCLPIYFNYAYPNDHYSYTHIASTLPLSLMWKYFTESDKVTQTFKEHMLNNGANLVTVGYIKMDRLAEQKKRPSKRKSIIIAPHHSVGQQFKNVYNISTFMQHADLYQKLPELYPEIDFIFRPHPLLFPTLAKNDIWGKEKTEAYFREIQSHNNMTWQNGGDYFETFTNADGMIHDCGSFVSEFVYTGKPMCFLLSHEKNIDYFFMENGAEILRNSYLAYTSDDIRKYIEQVIICGNDEKSAQMAKSRLTTMVNYPNATSIALQHIKQSLGIQ